MGWARRLNLAHFPDVCISRTSGLFLFPLSTTYLSFDIQRDIVPCTHPQLTRGELLCKNQACISTGETTGPMVKPTARGSTWVTSFRMVISKGHRETCAGPGVHRDSSASASSLAVQSPFGRSPFSSWVAPTHSRRQKHLPPVFLFSNKKPSDTVYHWV